MSTVLIGTVFEVETAGFIVGDWVLIITPTNNPSLSPLKLNLPASALLDAKTGVKMVEFKGWFYTGVQAGIHAVYDALMEIQMDHQVVDITYPPEPLMSGSYYINDVSADVVHLASGVYSYRIDCERVS